MIYFFRLIKGFDTGALQSGTYEKMVKLLDNYNPDVTVEENPTDEDLQEEKEFLNEIFSTEILQKSYEFLQNHKYVNNLQEFRDKVYKLWFELYDRDGHAGTTLGSRYVKKTMFICCVMFRRFSNSF